ncbi:LAMI_0F08746g1_1 [Lachancea mirantina]|uniref:Glucosidase II subunit alpha n=1 Tax=Lachancea mirantina TaxID=1230905 RepID=A0A1G4K0M6_9SACH|nr:LAMI_0F08746g1_1 [Lachancea mirantina]
MRILKLLALIFLVYLRPTAAFTDYLIKKCSQSGFCVRNRHYANEIGLGTTAPVYSVDRSSVKISTENHTITAIVEKRFSTGEGPETLVTLPLTLDIMNGSSIRFTIDENRDHIEGPLRLNSRRYNETAAWAFSPDTPYSLAEFKTSRSVWPFSRSYLQLNSVSGLVSIRLHYASFKLEIFYKKELVFTVNDRSLLNIEHARQKELNQRNKSPAETTFSDFSDSFRYSKDDTLPFGPESVAMDFTFHNIENVYGIPEHADSLRLKETVASDPYRLFNVDVFEYDLYSGMPMYGSIPFMLGSRPGLSAGVFWVNAADTWIDVSYESQGAKTHWMSEAGILDVVLFLGDQPSDITSAYTLLTGRPNLPSLSSIGYHQCRWNYNDEKDVLTVDSQMDKAEIPYDFIWLDLEYTDNKKFFTWRPDAFPNPLKMLKKLHRMGRNLVALIDPHLKVGYEVSDAVEQSRAAVLTSQNDTYHGHCWPGESLWIDTFGECGITIWSSFIQRFVDKTKNLFIWNDMNEPSIFSGPETTAPKDLIHAGGFEERSLHNLYGLSVHEATYNAMTQVYGDSSRPFILTRAFFAGSQRTAATWTGDNMADWGYLRISIPMCLTNNLAGFPFIGADIAGFSGDPSNELIVRWYQAGMWYPFFRAHAHIDALRREPYLFEDKIQETVRKVIRLRYSLLPTFYTAFHDASVNGTPIMKPLFYAHPELDETYKIDDQFYLGNSGLLVKPVTTEGETDTQVFFAAGLFYDYFTLESLEIHRPGHYLVNAPLTELPVYLEGGNIIFRKDRYRRSAKLMARDPVTLVVAPTAEGVALGSLYLDDGETLLYQGGDFLKVEVTLKQNELISQVVNSPDTESLSSSNHIERIIVALSRQASLPSVAKITQGNTTSQREITLDPTSHFFVIQNPGLVVGQAWSVVFE